MTEKNRSGLFVGFHRALNRFRKNTDGAFAIEFAFLFPVTALFMLGITEFGRALWVYNSMHQAAESGARWAMVRETATDDDIKAATKAQVLVLDTDKMTVTITRADIAGEGTITVKAAYTFKLMTSFFTKDDITVDGEATVPDIYS